jgi:hypothetical protein
MRVTSLISVQNSRPAEGEQEPWHGHPVRPKLTASSDSQKALKVTAVLFGMKELDIEKLNQAAE